jgi:Zinc finger protein
MMEDLDLDILNLAAEIAIGLAILHWEAQIDGMDTEFVLGSSATWDNEPNGSEDESSPPDTDKVINFNRREIHLWMLDYDKATAIEMTEEDIKKKLVPGFLGNDPYYPMPTVDEELWDAFCGAYLKASDIILRAKGVDKKVRTLPQQFLDSVVEQVKKNEDWDAEENIVFKD